MRFRLFTALPAVLLLASSATVGAGNGRPAHVKVVAEFADAGAILPGNDVRVDGVSAGRITDIRIVDRKARLTLSLDGAFAPIHTDATVAIRPVSLLGERFVDLDRGSAGAPALADGGFIPAAQTRRSVDLDEVLSAVDDPTGDALSALLVGLGGGMAGRGQDAAAAIKALGPALRDTSGLLTILSQQNSLLTALIDRAQPALSALGAGRGAQLDALVKSTKGLLDTTAAAAPQMGQSLERLPGALATARAAFVQLASLAGNTTPLLASLRPLTGDLSGFATDLGAFADAAGPALASLDPVLVKGNELIGAAQPVVADLARAGGDLESVARAGHRISDALPADLANLLDFVRNFTLASAGSDGISHYLRVLGTMDQEDGDGRSPVPVPRAPYSHYDAAGPGPAPSGDPGGLLGPPAPVGSPGQSTPAGPDLSGPDSAGANGSATGLTAEQERSLLQYFLGGR
jgi:phospholipid/cholesterol/gamma-HCH transport system substrate-binding protein